MGVVGEEQREHAEQAADGDANDRAKRLGICSTGEEANQLTSAVGVDVRAMNRRGRGGPDFAMTTSWSSARVTLWRSRLAGGT